MSTEADEKMTNELNSIFAGKKVIITDTPIDRDDLAETSVSGVCKNIKVNMADVDVELIDGSWYGFSPDSFSPNSIEGEVNCELRRKVGLA